MSKAKLFQYAVIWNPTAEQEKKGDKAKVVIEPTTILSKDEQTVGFTAIREVPAEYAEQLEQLDIVVRAF